MSGKKAPRTLSAAARKRRHDRNVQRRFLAAGGSIEVLSAIERRCPCDFDQALLEVGLYQVRHRLRENKKVYGGNIAKKTERLFGPFAPSHRAFFVEWINWLVQNRFEIASGRYSAKNAPATMANMIAGAGNAAPSTGAPAPALDSAKPVDETSSGQPTLGGDADAHQHPVDVSATRDAVVHQPPLSAEPNLNPDNSGHSQPLDPNQSLDLDDDEELEALRAKLDSEARSSNARADGDSISADSHASSQGVLGLHSTQTPKRPDPFHFRFKVEGELDANAFFRSIHNNQPINEIVAAAKNLANNHRAVETVIRRGKVEADYLAKAMSDLGIELP